MIKNPERLDALALRLLEILWIEDAKKGPIIMEHGAYRATLACMQAYEMIELLETRKDV